ncbi:Clan SC, family S9, unassigned serine peptidase [Histomonas meleagridis]|uniref:Clan SC, family S9, unassigned serine peptidase n=1 Tax=Histomonas meleagridis TaxID=135588 RepID=UPI00355A3628|nr:Clan SC, family S9, unassigned serine peptidase [Histomonas meleagridis]KAH0798571.1 Clan SC, family S9, unassigned serine peptidase [Histomonas meleagridis]
MGGYIEQAINAIIRPPRHEYNHEELPLVLQVSEVNSVFLRHPVSFKNSRDINIIGSIYHAADFDPLHGGPCIVYLHGNASSQLEGQFLVPNFCPHGVFVFCFDFAGCGCSEGEYVSLGYFEQQDTEYLIQILHSTFHMGPFILWGRSMGAATALLVDHPHVIAKISDSSFTSIIDMCTAIASSLGIPNFVIPSVLWYLKKAVYSRAGFHLEDVSPLTSRHEFFVPVIFGHAQMDKFIPFEQCKRLYELYPSTEKHLMELPGGHNSVRKETWISYGVLFALKCFGVNTTSVRVTVCRKLQSSTFHFSSFTNMMGGDDVENKESKSKFAQEIQEEAEKMMKRNAEKSKRKHKGKHHHKNKKKEKKQKRDKASSNENAKDQAQNNENEAQNNENANNQIQNNERIIQNNENNQSNENEAQNNENANNQIQNNERITQNIENNLSNENEAQNNENNQTQNSENTTQSNKNLRQNSEILNDQAQSRENTTQNNENEQITENEAQNNENSTQNSEIINNNENEIQNSENITQSNENEQNNENMNNQMQINESTVQNSENINNNENEIQSNESLTQNSGEVVHIHQMQNNEIELNNENTNIQIQINENEQITENEVQNNESTTQISENKYNNENVNNQIQNSENVIQIDESEHNNETQNLQNENNHNTNEHP